MLLSQATNLDTEIVGTFDIRSLYRNGYVYCFKYE